MKKELRLRGNNTRNLQIKEEESFQKKFGINNAIKKIQNDEKIRNIAYFKNPKFKKIVHDKGLVILYIFDDASFQEVVFVNGVIVAVCEKQVKTDILFESKIKFSNFTPLSSPQIESLQKQIDKESWDKRFTVYSHIIFEDQNWIIGEEMLILNERDIFVQKKRG